MLQNIEKLRILLEIRNFNRYLLGIVRYFQVQIYANWNTRKIFFKIRLDEKALLLEKFARIFAPRVDYIQERTPLSILWFYFSSMSEVKRKLSKINGVRSNAYLYKRCIENLSIFLVFLIPSNISKCSLLRIRSIQSVSSPPLLVSAALALAKSHRV